jgi:predicted metal-dependent peptidase
MSMREVFKLLKEEEEEGGGGGKGDPQEGGQPSGGGYQFDEHDTDGDASSDDLKEMNDKIDRALREGALLAGRLGVDLPRAITDILTPQVDWREALRDFVTASCKGKDEYTWRKFNRRLLPSDIYLPTVENETIGEVVVAIDTSGSIGQDQINEFATELVSICEAVEPDAVRVLWWDTKVHGQQLFTDNYQNIGTMLKPQGGGGTRVSCVSEYINKHKLKAECVLVFTDGYLENDVKWNVSDPTLWMITDNKDWEVPSGKKVIFNR